MESTDGTNGSGTWDPDIPTPTEWKRRGRRLAVPGGRLFHVEEGAGHAVLLLHGLPAGSWIWHRMLPGLAHGHRVVAPDLLGFGFSDKPVTVDYGIGAHADRVERLVAILRVEAAHLIGHAYGGSVVQELLARQAEGRLGFRARTATFLSGGLFPEANRPSALQRWMAGPAGRFAAPLLPLGGYFFRRNLRSTFGPASPPSKEVLRAMWSLFRRGLNGAVLAALLRYPLERRRLRERLVSGLIGADVPKLFLVGTADSISAEQAGAWERRLGPDSLIRLPGVGHHPPLEAPHEVVRAWRSLVARSP